MQVLRWIGTYGTTRVGVRSGCLAQGEAAIPQAKAQARRRHNSSTSIYLCLASLGILFLFSHMAKHSRSRPKLRIAVVILLSLFLFTLSVWFMFPCKHCPERFGALSARGLTQHQRKCQAFLKHEAEANQRRKTTAASYKVRRTRLKDRKARLSSATPGVSFFSKKISWLIGISRKGPLLDQVI
jgi:hypothetical protein